MHAPTAAAAAATSVSDDASLDLEKEVLGMTRNLLDSIEQADYDTYKSLCDEKLTAFEAEALQHQVGQLLCFVSVCVFTSSCALSY